MKGNSFSPTRPGESLASQLAKNYVKAFGTSSDFEEYFKNLKSLPTLQERADAEQRRLQALPAKFQQQ
jgi:hypothetical protein